MRSCQKRILEMVNKIFYFNAQRSLINFLKNYARNSRLVYDSRFLSKLVIRFIFICFNPPQPQRYTHAAKEIVVILFLLYSCGAHDYDDYESGPVKCLKFNPK